MELTALALISHGILRFDKKGPMAARRVLPMVCRPPTIAHSDMEQSICIPKYLYCSNHWNALPLKLPCCFFELFISFFELFISFFELFMCIILSALQQAQLISVAQLHHSQPAQSHNLLPGGQAGHPTQLRILGGALCSPWGGPSDTPQDPLPTASFPQCQWPQGETEAGGTICSSAN